MNIIIRDLTHSFNKKKLINLALNDLNIKFKEKKITGIVGPDGAGKTTLLRLISGLLKPVEGSILINGLSPTNDLESLRSQIGYMPQQFSLYEDLTVLENLVLYASLNNIVGEARKERFEQLLGFTSLEKFVHRLAGKLSGGMKQKLGLACVLIGSPKLLLMDEPSVGVDPISRKELWKMVSLLAKDGMTVIWSTAYMDEAEHCDDLILMNKGAVLYQGTPDSLFSRMKGRSYLMIEPKNGFNQKRQVLKKMLDQPEVLDGLIRGADIRIVLCKAYELPDLQVIQQFSESAVFLEIKSSLEDAFIDLLEAEEGAGSKILNLLDGVANIDELDMSIVINAKALTKSFGTFKATNDVSLSVKRGQIFGLLGPNGAGKSTIFKMMCGLLLPTSGDIDIMGINLKKSPADARQHIGYMSQKFAMYGQLSVKQNLMFFAGIYGLFGNYRKQQVDKMINIFSLGAYINTNASILPLGFKQRLALACAIMHSPRILFLDEPTSGVDPLARREFWHHINELVTAGMTVMVTTHFMDEAEYCDHIALIYHGKIIASDTPDGIKMRCTSEQNPNPNMEDSFIELVARYDSKSI